MRFWVSVTPKQFEVIRNNANKYGFGNDLDAFITHLMHCYASGELCYKEDIEEEMAEKGYIWQKK